MTNRLKMETSIHWHGIMLPAAMDGVPGMSLDGIVFRREVAPYLGVTCSNKFGSTAGFARANGERLGQVFYAAGVRFWWRSARAPV